MDEQVKAAFNQVHFILDQIIFHRSAINYIDAKELGGYLSKLVVIINDDPQNRIVFPIDPSSDGEDKNQ